MRQEKQNFKNTQTKQISQTNKNFEKHY